MKRRGTPEENVQIVRAALMILIIASKETTATGSNLDLIKAQSAVLTIARLPVLVTMVEDQEYLKRIRLPRALEKDFPGAGHPQMQEFTEDEVEAAAMLAKTWLV